MSVAAPPRPPVAVQPGRRPPAPTEHKPNCTAAWTLIGVLLGFKVFTITLILVAAHPSDNLIGMLIAMNWLWLVVLGILLSVIPFGFWFRLVRARSRRRKLLQSEWQLH